jgi:transmembrane sensor
MNGFSEQDGADKRLEEAAQWRLRLAENDGRASMDFDVWLREAGNRAAWDRINGAWDAFDDFADAPEMAALRRAALDDAARARGNLTWHRLAAPLQAIAAVLLLVCLAGGGSYWWLSRPDDYRTAVGERRVVALADGSRISLDSNSEVTVKYAAHQRALHLVRGQARFDVAHDRSRPFSVVAGNQKVIATGTAFNIDLAGSKVLVTLIEGHVLVLTENSGARDLTADRFELRAGQQLAAAAHQQPRIIAANLSRVTAWTAGQLVFENEPLSSVVDRVNRYSDIQVVVSDPAIGEMKISGVFNAGDPQSFVNIVTRYLRIQAVPQDAHTIALRRVSQ